ncbi:MAG: glycosyltransferase family 4 protein [Rhodocyclaceae bacterium]|nr:glycosyltransferase family 4 protein [Rhodocyclaceae bacterium]
MPVHAQLGLPLLLAPLLAFLVSAAGLALLLRTGWAHRLAMDLPNHRSLHDAPIPRVGGIVVIPVAIGVTWGFLGLFPVLVVTTLALCAISFVDDRWGVPIGIRLGGHLLAAAWLVSRYVPWPEGILVALVSVVAIGWLANLYNFMDGADGLAGGMALLGFAALGAGALLKGAPSLAILAFCVSGAAAGFLVFNFPPARIFMGDGGSVPLGFLAGAIGFEGLRTGLWPAWFPLLVFSPFVVDATVTLGRRILRRERFWEPHRDHYYQRLVRMGWSHRRVALVEYAVMLGTAATGLVGLGLPGPGQAAVAFAWLALFAALMAWVDRRWRRTQSGG